jgi:tetratricopeptide (TPR) repeat protein
MEVQLGNIAGQASTLGQLGLLSANLLGRAEDAVTYFRQAADWQSECGDVASEGLSRNSLGLTLRELGCLHEARQEIRRAIECKQDYGHASEPGKSWAILADVEADAGNTEASFAARQRAVEYFTAYRRDRGENHDPYGRLALVIAGQLVGGAGAEAAAMLDQLAVDPDLPTLRRPFITALQAVVAGSRDLALADSPDLNYQSAVDLRLLIESLTSPPAADRMPATGSSDTRRRRPD